jgi:hypothetical protein
MLKDGLDCASSSRRRYPNESFFIYVAFEVEAWLRQRARNFNPVAIRRFPRQVLGEVETSKVNSALYFNETSTHTYQFATGLRSAHFITRVVCGRRVRPPQTLVEVKLG